MWRDLRLRVLGKIGQRGEYMEKSLFMKFSRRIPRPVGRVIHRVDKFSNFEGIYC